MGRPTLRDHLVAAPGVGAAVAALGEVHRRADQLDLVEDLLDVNRPQALGWPAAPGGGLTTALSLRVAA